MIVSMGIIVAVAPDDPIFDKDPHEVDWSGYFVESGFTLNSDVVVRPLSGKYDVPGVLAMHHKPVSFHPETKFVSLTAAVLDEGAAWPTYTGTTEVTAVIETGAPHRVPRAVVDNQDRTQGLKANKGLLP